MAEWEMQQQSVRNETLRSGMFGEASAMHLVIGIEEDGCIGFIRVCFSVFPLEGSRVTLHNEALAMLHARTHTRTHECP